MADNSAIEWTDATWNPVTGCTKIGPGCDNCYAERFRGVPGHPYEQGFDLTLRQERLDQPARWRRPRMIFVNSMSDLFHKSAVAGVDRRGARRRPLGDPVSRILSADTRPEPVASRVARRLFPDLRRTRSQRSPGGVRPARFRAFCPAGRRQHRDGTKPEPAGGRCRSGPADRSSVAQCTGNRVSGCYAAAALRQLPQAPAQTTSPAFPGHRARLLSPRHPDAHTLARHPLRGAIFESFVVSELIKSFANRRREAPIYYWRDATGREIDALIDLGGRLVPVEVKSGETVPADAVQNLEWWTGLPDNPTTGGLLVHGGKTRFRIKGFDVLPWFLG